MNEGHFLHDADALSCIHCGLCLSSCPTYLETGDENQSPRGRIYRMRALQEGRMEMNDATIGALDLCLGCRACEAACPSGVPYGRMLEHTRDAIESRHSRPWLERLLRRVAIEQVFPYPERLELALVPAAVARALGIARWLPGPLRDALALVPERIERVELPGFSPSNGTDAGKPRRAGLLAGCAMRVLFGPAHAATVRLLNAEGFDVVVPDDQVCCGALHAHGGQLDAARERARANIAAFERAGVDLVVVNAAGCGSTMKEYGELLSADPAWAARAREFSARVKDLCEVLRIPSPSSGPRVSTGKVTYHDACHLAHAQRITRQPRDLVKAVAGADYVELPEADVCCGSAGTYNLTEPAMAARLQERKTRNVLATGARTVISANPGCLLQLRAGLDAAGAADVEVLHLAEYLDRAARVTAPR